MKIYKKISAILTRHDKKFLFLLMGFSVFIAILETIGIAAIMPFISISTNFSLIDSNKYYHLIYHFFGFNNNVSFVMAFGVILVFFYFLRGALNLAYYYALARFSNGRIYSLSYKLFENYLGMNYYKFINHNSAKLSKNIVTETQNLSQLIRALLMMLSEIFVVIFIYSAMIYVNWKMTLVMTLFLGLNVLFLVKIISKKIKKQGTLREKYQQRFFEIITSTFGNFKLIKLQSNDKLIIDEFKSASLEVSKAGTIFEAFSQFPRIFLETLGFGILSSIVIYLVFEHGGDIRAFLGIISMFVLGLYRLMPSANRLLTNFNAVMYYHKSLDVIHNDLMFDNEKLGDKKVNFRKNITLKNISFSYDEKKDILKDLSLEIKKGQKIAFVGPSGEGKSTLVDIIIGIFHLGIGEVLVDGILINEENIKAWRKKVGYIPQSVYLFDGSVAQNVSFGKEYDKNKIKEVLKKAKILDFLEQNQDGIETIVGEGGIKLSGGQKQRIAIARALYQEPELLVLDEATSALDEEIEKEIMDEIYEVSKDKTLIIIAHRLSTIKRCEKVYKVHRKNIFEDKI